MRKMRKCFICVLGMILVASLLTGCGKAETSKRDAAQVRVGSMKGATTLGILNLMEKAEAGNTFDTYSFTMANGADEILPLMIKGQLDIALVPANVAAILYAKTEGKVEVIDINTLGVLVMLTGTAQVESVADLKGKTIVLTGKGTTPEASLRYLLSQSGLGEDDYTLEFKSEATEVAAVLAADSSAIGFLPHPFATAAMIQNESLHVVLDMNEEWKKLTGRDMVTGVTVVRKEFLESNGDAVEAFLAEHRESVKAINEDPAAGADLAVNAGIIAKAPIAQKAIPNCNLVCVTGAEMKEAVQAYLEALETFSPELVGGSVPNEDFYYLSK